SARAPPHLADAPKKAHSDVRKSKSRGPWRMSMRRPVKRVAAMMVFVLAALTWGSSLDASAQGLDQQQTLGMGLFNQHCRVCHTKPLLTSGQYGPVLSK